MVWRDPDGFEDLLASDNRMCPVRRDIQGRDSDACFMGDGLRFSWTLQTNIIRNQNFDWLVLMPFPDITLAPMISNRGVAMHQVTKEKQGRG